MANDPLLADELGVRRAEFVRLRAAGATYHAIALLYGVSTSLVRCSCKRAVKLGETTAAEIRWTPIRKRDPLSKTDYDRRWIERVKRSVVVNEAGCWIWQGNRAVNGYGQTNYRGQTRILHRRMYEIHNGVTLDRWVYACHTCDTKLCCNPEHLWAGTPLENQVDSVQKRRNGEQKVTHCPRGHEYNEENTTWKVAASGRPARECKPCKREYTRRRYHENREEMNRRQRERRQRVKQEQRA